MFKTVSVAIILLYFFGASTAFATEYETYDCEYFSVEYPSEYEVEKVVSISYEGWTYNFGDFVSVTVGDESNALTYAVPVNHIVNGSIFDDDIKHFFDTLYLKKGDSQTYEQCGEYQKFDNMFFSFEYDDEWKKLKTDTNSIRDTITYGVYNCISGMSTYVQVVVGEDDAVGFKLQTGMRGNIISGPVKHIVDTLKFKY